MNPCRGDNVLSLLRCEGTRRPLVSNHHGNINNQNNLDAAKPIIARHKEIDIVEIDFVKYNTELVSSHDYTSYSMLNGSCIEEWVEFVIIQQRRILWVDMKARMDLFTLCHAYNNTDVALLLFEKLTTLREYHLSKNGVDIQKSIMITTQDRDLNDLVHHYNRGLAWIIVTDVPFAWSYFWKLYAPNDCQYLVDNYVYNYFTRSYDFSNSQIVSIDLCFFNDSIAEMTNFILDTNIKKGTLIVLYNFKQNAPLVTIEGYQIVMQYDYVK